jgi:hypothetical protein
MEHALRELAGMVVVQGRWAQLASFPPANENMDTTQSGVGYICCEMCWGGGGKLRDTNK